MNLVHYSHEPLIAVRSVSQRAEADMKPMGLWVSVDDCEDNWRTWCEAERFSLSSLTHVHDVTLSPEARILYLTGSADIDAFSKKYGVLDEFYMRRGERSYYRVEWTAVAAHHQGIIIAPYIWSRRLDGPARWYYGWDCASGCIWDATAIADIQLRADRYVPAERAA